jgi:Na+/proline symporter
MAIGDEKKLVLSRRIATTWVIISLGIAVLIGIVGHAMSVNGSIPVLAGTASETIIIRMSDLLSREGVLYALIAGVVLSGSMMIFVWKYLVRPLGGVWNVYELLPAFIFASLAIVVVSLLTKTPDKEITDEFDTVIKMKDL